MTTPEESAPKTRTTDQFLMRPSDDANGRLAQESESSTDDHGEAGAELDEALSEAGLDKSDLSGT